MGDSKIDLVLHPIRIRILVTLGGQQLTPQQIARALPDVPQATLYRHINTLTEGGLLTVVEENAVRGTVEKVYALTNPQELVITPEELATLTKDQHMHYFTIFTISLVNQFAQYLASTEKVDFVKQGIGYRTHMLYMSDEDLMDFTRRMNEIAQSYLVKNDDEKRTARLFSTIFMPASDSDGQTQDTVEE